MTRQITRPIAFAVKAAEEFADGNLTHSIQPRGTDEPDQMLHALETMRLALVKVVANVRQGSEGVSTASAEIAQGNHDLSARTEHQASALEQTAASMEELGSAVKQNADNARQANQLAMNASNVAIKGGAVQTQPRRSRVCSVRVSSGWSVALHWLIRRARRCLKWSAVSSG